MFKRAVKHSAKLHMALAGPAGSGKTYTALTIATELAAGQPIAVIDTERGSASKYADLFTFDVLELETFHPDRYIEAITAATQGGYSVIVIDSLSHAWNGSGGLLELHEQVTKRQKGGNSYTAWADITPIHNRLVNALTGAPIHIIATMRSKTEYVIEQGANGKSVPRKVGTTPIQRDGMEFEFDIFADLDQDNTLIVQKSRCPELTGAVIPKPGKQIAMTLKAWLQGVPPVTQEIATQPDYKARINAVFAEVNATQETFRKYRAVFGIPADLQAIDEALQSPQHKSQLWGMVRDIHHDTVTAYKEREGLDWPQMYQNIQDCPEDVLDSLKEIQREAVSA